MGRKTEPDLSGLEVEELFADAEQEDIERAIVTEFGRSADDALCEVKIAKVDAKDKQKEDWCFTCSLEEFPILERIRREFGAGTYAVRVHVNGTVKKYFRIGIAPRLDIKEIPMRTETTGMAEALAQALQRQNEMMERLIQATMTRPLGKQETLLEKINIVELLPTIVAALTGLKTFLTPAPNNATKDMVEMLNSFMGVAEKLKGEGVEGKGESSMVDIIRDLLKSPMFEKMVDNIATMQPGLTALPPGTVTTARQPGIGEVVQPLAKQPTPQPAAQQPKTNGVSEQQQTIDPQLQALIHNLKYLTQKAAQASDVGLYADWIIDNVPQDYLKQMVADPNALNTLIQLVPEAAPYMGWFSRLINEVNEALTPDDALAQDVEHVQPAATASTTSDT